MNLKPKLISLLEDVIVIIVMFGIFLPVRLVFYNFVSDNWFGSFGLITLIVVLLVYLSKKNKLGFFGKAYWRTITRVHKGKRRILSYFMIGFSLYLWVSVIAGVNYAQSDPEIIELKKDITNKITPEEQKKLDDLTNAVKNQDLMQTQRQLMESYKQVSFEKLLLVAFILVLLPILDFTSWVVINSLLDNWFNGWLLHFGTVFLIEVLEIIAIMVYTYTQTKKKAQIPHS